MAEVLHPENIEIFKTDQNTTEDKPNEGKTPEMLETGQKTTEDKPNEGKTSEMLETNGVSTDVPDTLNLLRKQLEGTKLKCTSKCINPSENVYFETWDDEDRKSFGSHDLHDALIHRGRYVFNERTYKCSSFYVYIVLNVQEWLLFVT